MTQKGYKPEEYFTELSNDSSSSRVELVTVGTTLGATVPATLEHTLCNALVDTGVTRSCLSEEYYQQLLLPGLRPVHKLQVRTASGSSLYPAGTIMCNFNLGKQVFSFEFIVCRGLSRPCILGLDFLRKHKIGIGWSPSGKFQLDFHQQVLVESVKVYMSGPTLQTRQCIDIPSRSFMVLNAKATIDKHMEGGLYKVVPNFLLSDEYPELVVIPTIHNVEITETQCIPFILLNLAKEGIFLRKGEILRHLEKEDITVEEITTETMLQSENMEPIKPNCDIFSEKAFITSPADIDTHRKVKLQDSEVLDQYKKKFEELCEEYKDISSKDSSDIGKTPLITMEIETEDSPPVCQRPYNLPLKHIDWVQKELDTLEKAGVITRSVSPWVSPIVIVPKRTVLGEPPKKRLCVDYRVINSLLPKVNKAHSKAKGVLTLVPLPKIDEIYARLKGSKIYSGFDA